MGWLKEDLEHCREWVEIQNTYSSLDIVRIVKEHAQLKSELAQTRQERDQVLAEAVWATQFVLNNSGYKGVAWTRATQFLCRHEVAEWRTRQERKERAK